jgi:hypothetical protein
MRSNKALDGIACEQERNGNPASPAQVVQIAGLADGCGTVSQASERNSSVGS